MTNPKPTPRPKSTETVEERAVRIQAAARLIRQQPKNRPLLNDPALLAFRDNLTTKN